MLFFKYILKFVGFLPLFIIITISTILLLKTFPIFPIIYQYTWFIEELLWNSFLAAFVAAIISLPFAVWFSIYLSETSDKKFTKYFISITNLLNLVPSIVYSILSVLILIPIFKAVGITNNLLLLGVSFSFMLIPTTINKFLPPIQNIPQILKDNGKAIGMNNIELIFYIFLPYLKFKIVSIFLWMIAIVLGNALLFLFINNALNSKYKTFSEYLAQSLFKGDKTEVPYLVALILFIIINMIDFFRGILKKSEFET